MTRESIYYNKNTIFFSFFAATMITMILALPFSLMFEVPFMNIEKFLLFPP